MDVLAAINLAARLLELALQVKADAQPFIDKVKSWSSGDAQPTMADFAELEAMEQPFLDQLNDTSRDKR